MVRDSFIVDRCNPGLCSRVRDDHLASVNVYKAIDCLFGRHSETSKPAAAPTLGNKFLYFTVVSYPVGTYYTIPPCR